jgi:3-methylfumaryl-CoA hydratase
LNLDGLREWVGRRESVSDVASESPLQGLAALLDHETPPWRSGYLPPLGHWLHFLPRVRQSAIDVDGHPVRGGFLPPVPLPRRMWAGGRLEFMRAVPIGAAMERRSTIASVDSKSVASGEMIFVMVRHENYADGQLATTEEQDLVYREAAVASPATVAARSAHRSADIECRISPGPCAVVSLLRPGLQWTSDSLRS